MFLHATLLSLARTNTKRHTHRLCQTDTVHGSTAHLPNRCDGRVVGQHINDGFNGAFVEVIVTEAVRNTRALITQDTSF